MNLRGNGNQENTLIIITGPTACGKSEVAVKVAESLGCPVLSADSRQMFVDIPIGTAAPTKEQMAAVPHYFVGNLSLQDYYSAAKFEEDALRVLTGIWRDSSNSSYAVLCGGSMMYIDAVVRGIDEMPTVSETTREYVRRLFDCHGLDGVMAQLEILDSTYAKEVDGENVRRVMHALEICLESGKPYSSLRTGGKKAREFKIFKFAIDMPREELFGRINRRVEMMVEKGLIEEARRAFSNAPEGANSLNTVGYRELAAYFQGDMTLPEAVARIQKNTRVYAKKQLTWLRRDPLTIWIPSSQNISLEILNRIKGNQNG